MSKARQLADLGNVYDDGALSNRNAIINGNFDVWQRGTSITSNNSIDYIADRWATFANGDITTSRQSFTAGQTDVPNEPVYFVRWDVNTYASGDNYFQKLEDVRTLAGQTATISFYAKADTAITIRPRFIQNFGSGGSAEVVTAVDVANVTTSWQKFTITTSIPSISGKTIGTASYLEIELLRITDSFTGYIDLAQVQLEVGDTATPFEHRSYGDELARCQRYYYKWQSPTAYSFIATGYAYQSTDANIPILLPQELRANPTFSSSGNFRICSGACFTGPTLSLGRGGYNSSSIVATTTGLTTGDAYALGDNNDPTAYLAFDAEL